MTLTSAGYVLLPAALATFFLLPRWLYAMAVFSVPFSATAIVNVTVGNVSSGIQAFTLLGTLWMLRTVIDSLARGDLDVPREQRTSIALLSLFAAVILSSLAMPFIIDGSLTITSANLAQNFNNEGGRRLFFSFDNLTQATYLVHGVLFASTVGARNNRLSRILRSLRIYMSAAIFVSAWGWLQWLLYRLDLPYPTLFNNSITSSAQGYLQMLDDLKRISSVAVEPSIMSQFLLTALPFFLFPVLLRVPMLSTMLDRLGLILVSSAIFLSTSASGYVGIVAALCMTTGVLTMLHRLRWKQVLLVLFAPLLLLGAYTLSGDIQDNAQTVVLEKLTSYSGRERLTSIELAWGYFVDYPLLGVGWGSVTSHDLVIRLLASSGVLGLATFTLSTVWLLSKAVRIRRYLPRRPSVEAVVWAGPLVSFLTLLFICLLTGFPFVFGHFWFVVAMMIALPCIKYDRFDEAANQAGRETTERFGRGPATT
jgi:hypothetical protein